MTSDLSTDKAPRRRGTERILSQVGRHHFAFFKAYLEGIDPQKLATLYLETAHTSPIHKRTIDATVDWIRHDLKLLARRHGMRAHARMIDIPPSTLNPPSPTLPSLDEFREEHDPYDMFSESELLALFEEKYTSVTPSLKTQRNARLRKRQADALAWLQQKTNISPQASDAIGAWLLAYLAKQLQGAGMHTIGDLVTRINNHGEQWHKQVPRLGKISAARIEKWLALNHESIGAEVIPLLPVAVRPIEFGIVPFEYFTPLPDLSGEHGRNRGDRNGSGANNDREAIAIWLSKQSDEDTVRSYRKEAERFFMWATLERDKALSSIDVADCTAYQKFLHDLGRVSDDYWHHHFRIPQSQWMSDKRYERTSVHWRPFMSPFANPIVQAGVSTATKKTAVTKGTSLPVSAIAPLSTSIRKRRQALSPASQRQALVIVRGMFRWMCGSHYLHMNPWDSAAISRERNRINVSRSFTREQWLHVREHLVALPPSPATARLRFLVIFSYLTGLRLHELARAKIADIQQKSSILGQRGYYKIDVLGKGQVWREVPIPQVLIDELTRYLQFRGIASLAAAPTDAPLIERIRGISDPEAKHRKAMAADPDRYENDSSYVDAYLHRDGIYKILKQFFRQLAWEFPQDSSERSKFMDASTHWLRHTYATHALSHDVPLETVKNNMGHASIDTTSTYLDTDIAERAEHVEQFANKLFE